MAHNGGTKVNYGFYWSAKAWDMAMVPAEGGLLPGGSDRHYTRIPTVLFLLMAPLMGALYVVFLPVAGFALVGGHALRAAKTLAMDSFMHIAVAVSPSWAPGEAYLADRKRAKAERAAAIEGAGTRSLPEFGRGGWTDTGWGPGILKPAPPVSFFWAGSGPQPVID